MKTSISRIIIFGQQISQLKDFYTNHFGFEVIEETNDEWVVLKAGEMEIALHKIGQQYLIDKPFKADSNTKLVFSIKSGLPTLRQNLLDKGIKMQEIKTFPGINSLFCDGADPEGNMFQLEERLD